MTTATFEENFNRESGYFLATLGSGYLAGVLLLNPIVGITYAATGYLVGRVVYEICARTLKHFNFEKKLHQTASDIVAFAAAFFAGTAATWAFLTLTSKTVALTAAISLNAVTLGTAAGCFVLVVIIRELFKIISRCCD